MNSKVTWSNGVAFYPPSEKYWRIGGEWYDFSNFNHPGGKDILYTARDRFEDCTFVFESHHLDFIKAREIIKKYKITNKDETNSKTPLLLNENAFYSVLRKRVSNYLKSINNPHGLPTKECLYLFYVIFILFIVFGILVYNTGSLLLSSVWGIISAWLGAFGHNWVHIPKYKTYALFSLDPVGLSSETWYRSHVLQHHMYTNTPWDNHFKGTDPFLITDPTRERNFLQAYIFPYINPLLLSVSLYMNYISNLVQIIKGNDTFTIGKLFLPLIFLIMISKWKLYGLLLLYVCHGTLGIYYFTIALMNHNTYDAQNVSKRNKARDWAEAQLISSADWCIDLSFYQSIIFLWLNYHTVHHLFPKVDFSHHYELTKILIETCKEYNINYNVLSPFQIYKECINTFSKPQSLMQTIDIYAGGDIILENFFQQSN